MFDLDALSSDSATTGTMAESEAPCCPPGSHGPSPAAAADVAGVEVELEVAAASTPGAKLRAYVTTGTRGGGWSAAMRASGSACVCFPDIWGVDSGTTREVADDVSRETGTVVVVVDPWEADAWPAAWGPPMGGLLGSNVLWFIPWMRRHFNAERKAHVVAAVHSFLESNGAEKWAWYGFCGGCLVGAAFAKDPRNRGSVAIHPAFNAFALAGGPSLQQAIGAMKGAMLVMPAKNDGDTARVAAPEALRAAGFECRVRPFDEEMHGFVPRGDVNNPTTAKNRKLAIEETSAFVKSVLS